MEFAVGTSVSDAAPSTVALRAHVQECPACAALVRSQRSVWGLLDEWELAPPSSGFNREVYRRIESAGPESFWERCARFVFAWVDRPAVPLAAASLLILAGFFVEAPPRRVLPPSSAALPRVATPPEVQNDAQQINEAFDDLQLLHQLDVVKDEAPSASNGM